MIPWNPIHRYAGMTSLFDSLDEQQPRDLPQARPTTGAARRTSRVPRSARRLGFVDVRAEAATAGDDSDESASRGFTADEPEMVPAAAPVEFAAVDRFETATLAQLGALG